MVATPGHGVTKRTWRQPSLVNGEIRYLDQRFVLGLESMEMRRVVIIPKLLNDDITG
jgi:hypothetical protein